MLLLDPNGTSYFSLFGITLCEHVKGEKNQVCNVCRYFDLGDLGHRFFDMNCGCNI